MTRTTLRKARNAAGFRLYEVADLLGVHQSQISRIERGIRKATFEQAQRMAALYGVSLADICEGESPRPSEQARHIFAAAEGILKALGLSTDQIPDTLRLLSEVSEAELPDAQDEQEILRMKRAFAQFQMQRVLDLKPPKRG